jgi:opacity protein-like surface antigen
MVIAPLVAPLLAPLASAPPAFPLPQFHGEGRVQTSLWLGLRDLSSDFDPASGHTVLGIDVHVHEPASRAGLELGYFYSWGDGSESVSGGGSLDVTSSLHEFWAGGRWQFDPWESSLKPYVGVGFSLLYVDYETSGLGASNHADDWAFGVYGHAGLSWEFAPGWSLDLDVRTLYSTKADLQDSTSLDYLQAGLVLGWAW